LFGNKMKMAWRAVVSDRFRPAASFFRLYARNRCKIKR
jgi:hypothetical protein